MSLKTTRITVETDTLLIVRRGQPGLAWCPECGADVSVIRFNDHNFADLITAPPFQQWLAAGELHYCQPPGAPPQVCMASLLRCVQAAEAKRICQDFANQANQLRRKQK